jgi:ribose transport system permease protein
MNIIRKYGVLIAMAALFVIFSISMPDLFLTFGNLRTIIMSQATLLMLAVAITVPLRAGEFDLSIGSIMSVAMLGACLLSMSGYPFWMAVAVGVAFGATWGAINALMVVGFGINGLIATLGSATVLSGIGYGMTDSTVLGPVVGGLLTFSRYNVLGLPLAVYHGWATALAIWILFELTPLGRYWLFAGGNSEAARLSGVKVTRVKVLAFVCSGAICGFAGVVLAGINGAGDPTIADQYLLPPFAAAFLGTAVIQEGRFNVVGTVIGIYLISIGNMGLALSGAPLWASQVFAGGVLLAAVGVSRLGRSAAVKSKTWKATGATANHPSPRAGEKSEAATLGKERRVHEATHA